MFTQNIECITVDFFRGIPVLTTDDSQCYKGSKVAPNDSYNIIKHGCCVVSLISLYLASYATDICSR